MNAVLPLLLSLACIVQDPAPSPTPTPVPVPPADLPALLNRLDASFAALGRFRAEYDVTGIPLGEGGPELGRVTIYGDLAASRGAILMFAVGEKEASMRLQFEGGWTGWTWRNGDAVARKADLTILARLWKRAEALGAEIDRLVGRHENRACHGQLHIRIDGKPAKDQKGNMRFAVGTTTGLRASWLLEIASAKDAVVRRAGGILQAELPSARKIFTIDEETGLLRTLSVRDYDDTVRAISLASFAKGEAAPDLGRPAAVKSSIPSVDDLAVQVDEFSAGTWCGVPAIAGSWEALDAEGKAADAKRVLGDFCREVLHLWLDHALQSFARQFLAGRLAQGATPATLKRDADLEFARFGESLSQPGPSKQLTDFVKDRAGRFQAVLSRSLEKELAGRANRDALIRRTLEATCGTPSIDAGDALILRAKQAFFLVIAHPEEL